MPNPRTPPPRLKKSKPHLLTHPRQPRLHLPRPKLRLNEVPPRPHAAHVDAVQKLPGICLCQGDGARCEGLGGAAAAAWGSAGVEICEGEEGRRGGWGVGI